MTTKFFLPILAFLLMNMQATASNNDKKIMHEAASAVNIQDGDAGGNQTGSNKVHMPASSTLPKGTTIKTDAPHHPEEKPKVHTFHYDRVRRLKRGVKFCCSFLKLVLIITHICLLLLVSGFLHH